MISNELATLHHDLPREGPGSDDLSREALRRLPALKPQPLVADLGCGPGRQTLVLARALKTRIIAVDCWQPYLDRLTQSAADQGLSDWIETRCQDMGALDIPAGSLDLLWSEGAAYILGFEEALRRWRNLLAFHGLMAVTECTWLTDDRPLEARTFWHEAYPTMGNVAENVRLAQDQGFRVLDRFVLPEAAWWDEYYTPLLERIAALRPNASRALESVLDETEREIDLYRKHGHSYGYVFYLLAKSAQ
jgi:serine/threonine-protein kinase HipA